VAPASPAIILRGVSKDYRGLRPLRIERLEVLEGESVALIGFDQAMAEVLVSLITGATTPDSGDVTVFGQSTRHITDGDAWLQGLDQFGILSDRAVLLEQLTAEQNLAVPFSLDVDQLTDEHRVRVRGLAEEVVLGRDDLRSVVATLPGATRQRIRLARAIAHDPRVLLAEHPNASIDASDVAGFAADLAKIVAKRGLTHLLMTADRTFGGAVGSRVLELQPATGALTASSGWRKWFS
jgi:predicted ABC-type transport system involved in lysophospholipase L1 biosynthesis ATPase subunit